MNKTLGDPIHMGNDSCPYCNKHIDTASGYGGTYKPAPGDFSVCIGCAGIVRFADDMAMEKYPDILLDTLEEELRSQILHTVHMIKQINKDKNHEKTNGKA